jgi:hypothetical protein
MTMANMPMNMRTPMAVMQVTGRTKDPPTIDHEASPLSTVISGITDTNFQEWAPAIFCGQM